MQKSLRYQNPTMASFDLLALPGELRNQIYRLALTTDPSQLDRQHKYDCDWCTWHPDDMQNPVFDKHHRRQPNCNKCWARSGLALLLANRQINQESAPIFWAENHFTFRGLGSFSTTVDNCPRPRYRKMITHITVLRDHSSSCFDNNNAFWHALFQCKGLRTLEIPSCLRPPPHAPTTEHPDPETGGWGHFRTMLPNLKTLSWIIWIGHITDHTFPAFPLSYKVTKSLDIEGLSPEQLKAAAPQADANAGTFYCPLCVDSSYPRALGHCISHKLWRAHRPVSTGRPHEYGCVERQGPRMVTWTVQEYLWRLSREEIARNARLKARDEKLKKEGGTGFLGSLGGMLIKLLLLSLVWGRSDRVRAVELTDILAPRV
ncbi:hypothetical protein F5883DRAFT_544064 [Diaporthe sp. PMI_573]|nr:hypothetical protein F5883DRAFT_544064 [Diaporthaceae sp. PMI_573]